MMLSSFHRRNVGMVAVLVLLQTDGANSLAGKEHKSLLENILHSRHKRNDDLSVRILSERLFSDGTKFQKIEEQGNELPPLPDEEEADDLNDPRIGRMNERGEVLVPVDDNGNVLPGYEHLIRPLVVDIGDSTGKINNPLTDVETVPSVSFATGVDVSDPTKTIKEIIESDVKEEKNDIEKPVNESLADLSKNQSKTATAVVTGAPEADEDYEDVSADGKLPAPLPPVDYKNSAEDSEDVEPMPSESIPVLGPNQNELGNVNWKLDNENAAAKEESSTLNNGETKEGVDSANTSSNPLEDVAFDEAEVANLAKQMGKEVVEKLADGENWFDGDWTGGASEEETPTAQLSGSVGGQTDTVVKGSRKSDGYILEDPHLSPEEVEKIREESSRNADGEFLKSMTMEPIVRGGRIGMQPDSGSSIAFPFCMLLLTFVLSKISI